MNFKYIITSIFAILLFCIVGEAKTDKYRCIIRDDPSTTMCIAWNQASGSNPILYYDEIDFGTDYNSYSRSEKPVKSVVAKGLNNKFVRLTNLMPNTQYFFVIKDSEGVSRRFYFKTIPDHQYERLSIVAGGDSRNNRRARKSANTLVAKLKPHVVLFGGDMTGGDNSKQWPQWMDDWQLTIASDGRMTPIVAARGNHEYSNKTLLDLFDAPNANVYYGLNFGGNLLRSYTLNSLISAGGEQASWLESDLQNNQDVIWKFAQYHYPIRPHTARKRNRENLRSSWATLFDQYKVNLVVECDGHVVKSTWPIRPSTDEGSVNGFIRDDENGTVYVGEGCWGAPLRENNHDKPWTRGSGSFNQFKWIFVDTEKVEIRTIKTDNAEKVEELSNYDIFNIPYGLDIWSPDNGPVIYLRNKNFVPAPAPMPAPPPVVVEEVVPVFINEIADFDVKVNQELIEMDLSVINESQPMYFEIQRSTNGEFYRTIDTLAVNNISKESQKFRVLDKRAAYLNLSGMYYRIKQIPKEGAPTYSEVKKIELTPWENYEAEDVNPKYKAYRFQYSIDESVDVGLKIFNSKGREEKSKRFTKQEAGDHTRIINMKDFLPGVYLIKLNIGDKTIIRRLIVPEGDS